MGRPPACAAARRRSAEWWRIGRRLAGACVCAQRWWYRPVVVHAAPLALVGARGGCGRLLLLARLQGSGGGRGVRAGVQVDGGVARCPHALPVGWGPVAARQRWSSVFQRQHAFAAACCGSSGAPIHQQARAASCVHRQPRDHICNAPGSGLQSRQPQQRLSCDAAETRVAEVVVSVVGHHERSSVDDRVLACAAGQLDGRRPPTGLWLYGGPNWQRPLLLLHARRRLRRELGLGIVLLVLQRRIGRLQKHGRHQSVAPSSAGRYARCKTMYWHPQT